MAGEGALVLQTMGVSTFHFGGYKLAWQPHNRYEARFTVNLLSLECYHHAHYRSSHNALTSRLLTR